LIHILQEKYQKLQDYIKTLGSAAVAFSGGVDSAFLLKAAVDTLGTDDVIAVTAVSCFFPQRESEEAAKICRKMGVRQFMIKIEPLNIEGIGQNLKNRCYLCKKEIFQNILALSRQYNLAAVLEGSNMDDMGDYRPGLLAIEELHIKSPLRRAGFTKTDIRALSEQQGLPTWNKPSFACLASRFVYGESITKERLSMVERAEQMCFEMGFSQVRVRIHGEDAPIARIELLPEEFPKMLNPGNREKIEEYLKKLGFYYVTLDLGGFCSGSMNKWS